MSLFDVSPTYVLKSWKFAGGQVVDETGCFVHLSGRSRGLAAWFLSLLGVEPTFSLRVFQKAALLETNSIFGVQRRMMPLREMTAVVGGLARPLYGAMFVLFISLALMPSLFGGLFFLLAAASDMPRDAADAMQWVGVAVGAIAAVSSAIFYYRFYKSLTIQFVESSGVTSGVVFMPSLIEGIKVDEVAAGQVAVFIDGLVLNARE